MPRKPKLVPPRKPPTPPTEELIPFDPFEDKPVRNDKNEVTSLTMPVRKMARLARDPGRGMMPSSGALDPVYCGYLESLPLDQLKFALAQQDTTKAMVFLTSLCDLTKSKIPITDLAKRAGIGLTEMMQIWRSHCHTAALGIAIEGTVPITGDLVEDAKSTLTCCTRCDGAGQMRIQLEDGYHWVPCINCDGSGATRRPGDSKSREYLYKATGFIKPDAGIQVHTHINTHSVDSVLDELDRLPPVVPVSSITLSEDDA